MPFKISVEVLTPEAPEAEPEPNEASEGTAPSKPKLTLSPFTDATVTLVPKASIRTDDPDPLNNSGLEPFWEFDFQPENYKHNGEGKYVADADKQVGGAPNPALDPAPGEWLLVVLGEDLSPVSQRLTLSTVNGKLELSAGWKSDTFDRVHGQDQVTAETVHIFNYKKGRGPVLTPDNALITVTLFERREIVSMTGFDGGGTRFIKFAEKRRAELHTTERANPGTRSAFFDVADGTRTLYVKAKKGWLPAQRKLPLFPVSKKAPPVGPDKRMSILELYRYLNKVGLEAPGSVIEVGIYSHAFLYGPIIWNTFDLTDDDTARDPADLDGRSKDWDSAGLMTSFPDLKQALADDGIFKVWGCNFDPTYTAKFRAANASFAAGEPRTKMFRAESEGVIEHLNQAILKHRVEIDLAKPPQRFQFYCASAAKHLEKPCFGAPPGTGANFIDMRMVVVSHDAVYEYLEREFGFTAAQRDDTNHLDYTRFANVTLAPPAWSTEHWLMAKASFNGMGQGPKKFRSVRLPGKVALLLHTSVPGANGGEFAKVEPASALVTNGLSGHLYIVASSRPEAIRVLPSRMRLCFLEADSDQDTAIYVQSDRRCFIMKRDRATGALSLDMRPVPLLPQVRSGQAWVDDPTAPAAAISDGLLFFDDPETHW